MRVDGRRESLGAGGATPPLDRAGAGGGAGVVEGQPDGLLVGQGVANVLLRLGVLVPDLVNTAREVRADAVLVSQVVTQKDAHIHNTQAMSAAFREAFPEGQVPLLVVGGPRFEEGSAASLGVDRIFGRGTTPGEVASYLVHALVTPRTEPDPRGKQR